MFRRFFAPGFLHETPGGAGGGGAPSQGAGAAVAQPPTPGGQGDGGDQPTADFWGLFPDVPEEQRAMMEPHLKNVQGHVTKMEQQYAPYKPLVDAGFTPDQVQGLMTFSQHFDQDPLAAWLNLGNLLQQADPYTGESVLHGDLDLEILAKIARGEELPDMQEPQIGSGEGLPQGGDANSQLMQVIQGLQQEVADLKSGREQDQRSSREQAQDRLLQEQFGQMRSTLKEAGFPETAMTDDLLRSAMITSRGNVGQALKLLQDTRSEILKGFTETATNGSNRLDLPNGAPSAPTRRPGNPRDTYKSASAGAEAFLKRQNQAAAQG